MIQYKDVSFRYDEKTNYLFHQLNLTFTEKKITSILGSNGCGKTTLLHLAYGWLQPQHGEIFVNNEPIKKYSHTNLGKTISIVSQNEKIPFHLSVWDYVLIGRTPYHTPFTQPDFNDYQIAESSLATTGMLKYKDHSLQELSGGEQQLVFIARAITQQPAVLLCDEITNHLDLHNTTRILQLLQRLKDDGVTIMLSLHDPQLASVISDEIVLFFPDHTFVQGNPQNILTPSHLSAAFQTELPAFQQNGQIIIDWKTILA